MSACSSREEPSDDVQQAVQNEEAQEDGEEQSERNTKTAESGSFFIQTVEQYPGGCDDMIDQGQEEQSEGARPELASEIEDISQYDTVFLGYKKIEKRIDTLSE